MRNPAKAINLVLLCLPAMAMTLVPGCARKPFSVEVAHGFSGYVHIFCGSTVGLPAKPVQVNSLGGADAVSCPGEDAEVTVWRDGIRVETTAMNWERAGDGTPVALSFIVK